MIFEQMRPGGDRNFGYYLADKKEGLATVIDPSGNPDIFWELIDRDKTTLKYIILTHNHADHTGSAHQMARQSEAIVVMHKITGDDTDLPVEDGEILKLGDLELKIIHTPGHSEDSICILCKDILVTGDTLFVGKVGGTDLGEGARQEYESLHKKIMTLPAKTRIYPGHDYGTSPSSTIGEEKKSNPFILCGSFEEFVDLKANWADYKKKHGLK